MNYRPVRGWALSFPVHAVAPSFPPFLHSLSLFLFLPFTRIGRACRQQRFFPSLRDPPHSPLHSPLSFSISSGKISWPPFYTLIPPRFIFMNLCSLNAQSETILRFFHRYSSPLISLKRRCCYRGEPGFIDRALIRVQFPPKILLPRV